MIYVITIIGSVIYIVMGAMSETTLRNIGHIKNNREPNAGFSLFPTIPVLPLIFCAIAFGINHFIPSLSIWIILILLTFLYVFWAFSYLPAKMELDTLLKERKNKC